MFALLLLSACVQDVAITKDTSLLDAQERLGLTDAQVDAVLDFVNDCATTEGVLDDDVGLDSDAARELIRARDGGDGTCGNADDARFGTLDEVDAVPQVGDQALRQIVAWVEGGATGGDGTWEGVSFTEAEAAAVVDMANRASLAVLDGEVGLASDEAQSLVDERPFATMDAVADAPQIGASALRKLKDYVPRWGG